MDFHLLVLLFYASFVRGDICSSPQNAVAHAVSCDKYIICQEGAYVEKQCAEGYHFDIFSESCQPAVVATCILSAKLSYQEMHRNILPPVLNTLPPICYLNTETTPLATIVTTLQTTEDVTCSIMDIGYLPNNKHCRFYYMCLFGILINRKCPRGFEFSPSKRTCLPKNIAGCMSSRTPATTTPTAPAETTPSTIRPVCDVTKIGYIPDFNDCRYYYICLLGSMVRKMCPNGYLFSTFVFNCLPEDQVNCPVITTSDSTTQYPITAQTTPYATTVRTTPYKITTQNTSPTTPLATMTSSTLSRLPQCTNMIGWMLVDPTDCGYYYTCVYGNLNRNMCKIGYYFDSDSLGCLPKNQVNCNPTVVSSIPSIITPYTTTTKTTPTPTSTQTPHPPVTTSIQLATTTKTTPSTITTPSTESTTVLPQLRECGDFDIWMSADPLDCGNYYLCVLSYLVLHHCQEGYKFDSVIQECLPENEVNCTNMTIISTTSSIKSTSTISTTHPISEPTPPTIPQIITQTSIQPIRSQDTIEYHTQSTITSPPLHPATINHSPSSTTIHTSTQPLYTQKTLQPIHIIPEGTTTEARSSIISTQSISHSIDTQITPEPITFQTITTSRATTDSTPSISNKPTQFTSQHFLRCTDKDIWIVSDFIDCKYFYACVLGVVKHVKCEPGHYFDSVTLDCHPEDQVDCKIFTSSSTVKKTNSEATDKTTTSLPPPPFTTTPSATTESINTLLQIPECGEFDIWMSVDPLDCANYYLCVLGYIELHHCHEEYKFDSDKQECLPENEVNCTRITATSQTSSSISSTTVSATQSTSMSTQATLNPMTSQPIIDNTISELTSTEASPSLISSQSVSAPQTTSHTITTPRTTTDSTPSISNKPIQFPLQALPRCGEFDIWMSADPLDCANYYLCVLGYVQLRHCHEEYKFDSFKQECLPENEVNCTRVTINSETSHSAVKNTSTVTTTHTTFVPTRSTTSDNVTSFLTTTIGTYPTSTNFTRPAIIPNVINLPISVSILPISTTNTTHSIIATTTPPDKITTNTIRPIIPYPTLSLIETTAGNTKRIPYIVKTETSQSTFGVQPTTKNITTTTTNKSTQNEIETTHFTTNIKPIPYVSTNSVPTTIMKSTLITTDRATTSRKPITDLPTHETTQSKINAKMVESTQSVTMGNPSTIIAETTYPKTTTPVETIKTIVTTGTTTSDQPIIITTTQAKDSMAINSSPSLITTYSTITNPLQPIKTTIEDIQATTQSQNLAAMMTTDTYTTTTTLSTTSATPLCGRSDVWFSPDPKSCNLYYICLFGILGHNVCPKEYHFSPQVLKCLPKSAANCTIITTVATPNITLSTTTTPDTTNVSKLDYYTTICKPNASWLWPDRHNCSFYYLCLVGSLKYIQCEDGYHFSSIELRCLPISQVKCSIDPSVINIVSSATTDTTQQATMKTIKSNTTIYSSTVLKDTTPSAISMTTLAKNTPSTTVLEIQDRSCNDSDVWITADPENCSFYYICIYGTLRHRKCPFAFYFDPKKRECLPRHTVECNVPVTTPTESEFNILELSTTPSKITTPATTTYATTTTATDVVNI